MKNTGVGKGVRGGNRKLGETRQATPVEPSERLTGISAGLRTRLEARRGARAERARERAALLETQGEGTRREWPRRLAYASLRLATVGAVAWALVFGGREVYDYATTSARFETKHFIYEPTQHLDDETLRELLAIEAGTNILALDPMVLGERIVAHPWVAQATVVRELPDTLEISIVEHEPTAIVLAENFYLVDAAGRPFKEVERGERGELPIITGVPRETLAAAAKANASAPTSAPAPSSGEPGPSLERRTTATVGATDATNEAPVGEMGQALAVLELYRSKQRPRLGEIHLDSDGSVTLYTAESGTQLRLGRTGYDARLERWDALRVALGSRADGLAVVHLDHESKPDRRDRVVARFVDERDEAVLLAQAGSLSSSPNNPGRAAAAKAATPSPNKASKTKEAEQPARAAGKRKRIPRYQ